MPPPIFLLCIPGLALFFFIQMVLCESYHFNVTVARTKGSTGSPQNKKLEDRRDKGLEIELVSSSSSMDSAHESGRGKNDNILDGDSSDENIPGKTPLVEFVPSEEEDKVDKDGFPTEYHPKEDRLKNRRKSIFAESYDPSEDDDDLKVVHPKTEDEKKWLIDHLQYVTLFQHLANDQIMTVVDAMRKQPVSKGDVIVRQGDKGTIFNVIQSGIFDVFVKDANDKDELVHTYNDKGSFGELALLYNQPRAATVVARSDGVLWTVDGQTFRRIVYKITYQKRMMYENLINNVPMLKSLQAHERANLVDALVPMTFENDQEIIKQGEPGEGMYFIISGEVNIIMRTAAQNAILLSTLSNGDYFGELALVTNKTRAASAYSSGTSHLAFLDREAFERLLGPCMSLIRRNFDNYNSRLSEILTQNTNT